MSFAEGVAGVRARLEASEPARDAALRASRSAVRSASSAIRCAHRGDREGALGHADRAAELARECRAAISGFPELLHAGYVHDAEKEVFEAQFVLAALFGTDEPAPGADGVSSVAYLHGACEAASELRRSVLEALRAGRDDQAARLFAWMESVYERLAEVDAPDAITAGLRRAVDALRAVLERTRGELAVLEVGTKLRSAVESARSALGAGGGFEPPTSGL